MLVLIIMIQDDPVKHDIHTYLHVYIYKHQYNYDHNIITRYQGKGSRELPLFMQHVNNINNNHSQHSQDI